MIFNVPFIIFWLLIFFGRDELGMRGILICITVWVALLAGLITLNVSPYWFTSAQALLDAVLVIIIFGGDIRIR